MNGFACLVLLLVVASVAIADHGGKNKDPSIFKGHGKGKGPPGGKAHSKEKGKSGEKKHSKEKGHSREKDPKCEVGKAGKGKPHPKNQGCAVSVPPVALATTKITSFLSTSTTSKPYPPSAGCQLCFKLGILHQQMPGTGCKNYTHESILFPSKMLTCPGNTLFNPKTCACSPAVQVQCRCTSGGGSGNIPAASSPTPKTSPTQPPSPVGDGVGCYCSREGNTYRPNVTDSCRSFTQEWTSQAPKKHDCPPGLLFNVEHCVCDWPHNVRCSCNQSINASTHSRQCHSCAPNGNIYRPVPGSGCRNFTHETATVPARMFSCPGNLHFDAKACVCNHPQNVACVCDADADTPKPKGHHTHASITAPATNVCSCSRNGVTFHAADSCRNFSHLLVNGTIVKHSCPTGLLFNVKGCICDRPQNVICSQCDNPSPVANSSGCQVCSANGNIHRQVLGSGCRNFSQETATLPPVIHACPANLLFDARLCVCNHPSLVNCACGAGNHSALAAVQTFKPTTAARIPSSPGPKSICSCSANGNIYRPVNGCRSFTHQAKALPHEAMVSRFVKQDCPTGLLFNTFSCTCDWPQNVRCQSECEAKN